MIFLVIFVKIFDMLKIRLQLTVRRTNPFFRVVLIASHSGPKSGKYVELLGSYDPKQGDIQLKKDRIKYWMSVGAQTSDTVHNFLISKKIIEGKKINVLPKKSPTKTKKELKEGPKDEGTKEEGSTEAVAGGSGSKQETTEEQGKKGEAKAEVSEEAKAAKDSLPDASKEASREEAKDKAEEVKEEKQEDKEESKEESKEEGEEKKP